MALRFYKNFKQADTTPITYRVELHGPAGADKEIFLMGPSPVVIRTMGASRDDHKTVRGSELAFNFLIPSADLSDYSDLFASDYKDWQIKYYNNDSSTLLWIGWVQPESLSRSIIKQNTNISLTATDALKDLSEVDFNNDGVPYDGQASMMQIIKDALTPLGIELDFKIKLGTFETTELSTQLTLLNNYVDRIRFLKNISGRTDFNSCLEVIEKVLQPFYCTLMQVDGKYRISALNEADTHDYNVVWSTLSSTRTGATDVINADANKLTPYPEKSLLPPVKSWAITHLNRNLGLSAVPYDENDFTNWTSTPTHNITAGFMSIALNDIISTGESEINTLFNVAKVSDSDYLKVYFTNRFTGSVYDKFSDTGVKIATFRVGVSVDGGAYAFTESQPMSQSYNNYVTPNIDAFKITQNTADYRVKIEYYTLGGATYSAVMSIGNMAIRRATVFEEDGAEVFDVTFDSYRRLTNTGQAKIQKEEDASFGDSLQFADIGAIYVNGGTDNSALWSRYGKTDNKPILELLGLIKMNDRQRYTEFLDIEFRDPSDLLRPDKILEFQSKYYTFNSYEKNYRHKIVRARLVERIYTDITYTASYTPLTSVDGEDTQRSTVISSPGQITETERDQWDAAYTERREWDGGATNLVASTGRTSLGLGAAATRADTYFGQITGTNNWSGLNRFAQGDIRFELDASNYIDLVADASNIYFRPVKADVEDLTRALRYRYGDDIWEFRGSLMVDDATAGTHAVNRDTGDARYGRLASANTWTQAQTWKITGNSYIDNAYWSGNGMYLRGYDDQATPVQAYILRTYASSGIQLELEKGGITANGDIIATGTVRAYG